MSVATHSRPVSFRTWSWRRVAFSRLAGAALLVGACSGDVPTSGSASNAGGLDVSPGPDGTGAVATNQGQAGSGSTLTGGGIAGGELGVSAAGAASAGQTTAAAAGQSGTAAGDTGVQGSIADDMQPVTGEFVREYAAPAPLDAPLVARAWRLSHPQYQRSIQELLGVAVDLSNFAPESGNGLFVNLSSTSFVRVDLANNYFNTAKQIAATLTEAQLLALSDCGLDAACADSFIVSLTTRAFRKPPNEATRARYRELFDIGAEGEGEYPGFRAVLQGVLNSPLFLYRTEIGAEADEANAAFDLTGYEVAQLLSYSIAGGPPPDWLFEAAEQGELTALSTLAPHLKTLVASSDASTEIAHFLREWLEVHDFGDVLKTEVFPGFEDAKPLIEQEIDTFLRQSGTVESRLVNLLTDAVPQVSSELDAFYLSDPSAPAVSNRAGVLGLGSVLAAHAKPYLTSPTLRGLFVRARFFCQEITLPESFTPPPLSETESLGEATSTRDLYQRHQDEPSCSVCHRMMDNIGFSMEAYDGAGRARTIDDTQGMSTPVDSTAELTDSDVNRPLAGVAELSQALSESELVRECLARQAFRFYFGQGEQGRGQLPIVEGHAALRQTGRLGDLLEGLFLSASTFARARELN